jgi:hypothetical protein
MKRRCSRPVDSAAGAANLGAVDGAAKDAAVAAPSRRDGRRAMTCKGHEQMGATQVQSNINNCRTGYCNAGIDTRKREK